MNRIYITMVSLEMPFRPKVDRYFFNQESLYRYFVALKRAVETFPRSPGTHDDVEFNRRIRTEYDPAS